MTTLPLPERLSLAACAALLALALYVAAPALHGFAAAAEALDLVEGLEAAGFPDPSFASNAVTR